MLPRVFRRHPQGSVTQAAESRKREAQVAESLAAEAAEVKKNLSENTGKQRDVSQVACTVVPFGGS